MNRTVLVAAAVAVAGLSVVGVLVLRSGTAPPEPTVASTSVPAAPAAAPTASAPAPTVAPAPPAPAPAGLLYEYTDVDTTNAQAVTFLIFHQPFDPSRPTHYTAF